MIDLRRLQVLRVLELHGTVTAAAEATHRSPSAVSQQIKLLSRDVGAELLERHGRTVRLTTAGRDVLRHAHRAAEEWEVLTARVGRERSEEVSGELALCGFATAVASLLAPAAADLRRRSGQLEIDVVETSTAEGLSRLMTGASDIAVLSPPGTPPHDDPRFEQHELMQDRMDLAVPAAHELVGRKSVQLQDAARDIWVSPHRDHRQLIEVSCAAVGFSPRFAHQADDWNAILALVEQGLGLCLIPRLVTVGRERAVVRVPIAGARVPMRQVSTFIRRGSAGQPRMKAGLAALRDVADGNR